MCKFVLTRVEEYLADHVITWLQSADSDDVRGVVTLLRNRVDPISLARIRIILQNVEQGLEQSR